LLRNADVCTIWAVPRDRSTFYQEVYEIVRAVPSGRVTTYGAIARALGMVHGARQVGWAMAAIDSDVEPPVPAHRVVNAHGALSGGWAFGHPDVQRGLLEDENVVFTADGRVPLESYLWEP
jgi:methylated-DNA-protein-cysteine methyltransferase related protein